MKITPVSQGTGSPGLDLGAVSLGRTSPDRIAAAKAIAMGQEPDRTQQPDRQAQRIGQSARSLKMQTDYSTNRESDQNLLTQPDNVPQTETDSPESPAATENKPLSPQFAALAKQRRAVQEERRLLQAEKQAIEAQKASTGQGIDLAKLKADPLSVLTEAGVTYEQLTEAIINGGAPSQSNAHIKALEDKIAALEKGVDTKLSERDQLMEDQAVSEMRNEARELAKSSPKYLYARAMDDQDKAADLAHRIWKSEGKLISIEEALEHINAESKKDWEAINGVINPPQANAPQKQRQQLQQPQMRTLTNRDGAKPAQSRRDRMLAAFYGNKT